MKKNNWNDPTWEERCQQCGACCFEKLIDEDGRIMHTRIPCRYLDIVSRRCRIYERRFEIYPECVKLTPELLPTLRWLPQECGYRQPLTQPTEGQSRRRRGKSDRGRTP